MSWFKYGDVKERRWKRGLWLRTRSLPSNILDQAYKFMRPSEGIAWVEVKELRPNNQVLLEFWATNYKRPERYTVFHILVDENPDWTVEGDMGRARNFNNNLQPKRK